MTKHVISLQNTNLDRKLHNFAIAYSRSEVYLNEKKMRITLSPRRNEAQAENNQVSLCQYLGVTYSSNFL
jgi:hypothetical protein